MSHANAALTPRHRLIVAQLAVDDGHPISEVAARFKVSWPKTSPNKTDKATSKRCISQEIRLREGPVQLAARLGIAPSTVHRILRLNRLSYMGRATGEPLRRYEHPHPGSLVHVDVKKLGNIPDGGSWRYVGRRQGDRNRAATPGKPNSKWHSPKIGYALVHTVLDDHSRVAYTEVHDDGTARPPSKSCCVRSTGLHSAASLSSASCRTTAPPTGRTCGATPAKPCQSPRSARAPLPAADEWQGRAFPPHDG